MLLISCAAVTKIYIIVDPSLIFFLGLFYEVGIDILFTLIKLFLSVQFNDRIPNPHNA